MDSQRDAKPFAELMEQLCATLRDGFKCSEAMRDAYWNALKDVSFAEVRTNAQRLMATATRDTPFPRPASLRNRPTPGISSPPTVAQEKADRDSIRRWNELKARDPIAFEIEFRRARAFTALAQCDEGDPDHEEWLREYRQWDRLRFVARDEQESAVKRSLGQS
jgi:hypothetical protein